MPRKIISDRGVVFTGRFWTSFQEALGTHLNFSTAYHPDTDGQTERTNQILKDMLQMYVMDHKRYRRIFYPSWNLLTIIVIRVPSRWHHLSYYMENLAEHLSVGTD